MQTRKELLVNEMLCSLQSGTALTNFAYNGDQNQAISEAHRLGDDLNCVYSNNEELMSCLRSLSAAEVLTAALRVYTLHIFGHTFIQVRISDINVMQ